EIGWTQASGRELRRDRHGGRAVGGRGRVEPARPLDGRLARGRGDGRAHRARAVLPHRPPPARRQRRRQRRGRAGGPGGAAPPRAVAADAGRGHRRQQQGRHRLGPRPAAQRRPDAHRPRRHLLAGRHLVLPAAQERPARYGDRVRRRRRPHRRVPPRPGRV
ncbi:MAG: hypothetical protein AVDCRST_MAG64-169, partial [uncultured Phycisphaerae bacterium]